MHICMVVFGDLSFDFRVYREAAALREAGHTITIVASDRSPGNGVRLPEEWDGFDLRLVPVDPSRSLRASYPRFWLGAARLLKQVTADAYHAHDLDTLWPAARAAKHCRVPLIYDSHELWTEQASLVSRPCIRAFWAALERRLLHEVHHTITVNSSLARILTERHGLSHTTVLRNLPPYRPPVRSDRIRAELHLDRDCLVILYQGGFLTDNGLAEQIAAMSAVDAAALVLMGSGPTEGQLRQQVADTRLEDRVFFLPRVPFGSLHEYTCSADLGLCLIKPSGRSFYYSLPNKLFEYMLAGLPILACESPEIRAVVAETGVGVVVDPTDVEAIGRHLRALIADPGARRRYSAASLRAAQSYTWESEAPKLVALYASLADAGKTSRE